MRYAWVAQLAFVSCAALAMYGFVRTAKDGNTREVCTPSCSLQPDYAGQNRLAPDFELPSIHGGNLRLSSLRGKVVVLNFWTKHCRPCLEEMPSIAELSRVLESTGDDVVVLTVSNDESVEDVRETLTAVLGAEPPFLGVVDAENDVVLGKYGTKLYPETWIIDAEGVIRARFDGPRQWDSAMIVDFVLALKRPVTCEVEFSQRRPVGENSHLCPG